MSLHRLKRIVRIKMEEFQIGRAGKLYYVIIL